MAGEDPDCLSATGQELAPALAPLGAIDPVPHDACVAVLASPGEGRGDPEAVRALSAHDLARIVARMAAAAEVPVMLPQTSRHVSQSAGLARWSALASKASGGASGRPSRAD
jgi:hypothetical protein